MTTILGLLAAAAAVLFWPKPKPSPSIFTPSPAEIAPAPPRGPTYQEAIGNLANVRKRLVDTDTLGDAEKEAMDTLTLALVAGSDS